MEEIKICRILSCYTNSKSERTTNWCTLARISIREKARFGSEVSFKNGKGNANRILDLNIAESGVVLGALEVLWAGACLF